MIAQGWQGQETLFHVNLMSLLRKGARFQIKGGPSDNGPTSERRCPIADEAALSLRREVPHVIEFPSLASQGGSAPELPGRDRGE